jgi:hypothetical protein
MTPGPTIFMRYRAIWPFEVNVKYCGPEYYLPGFTIIGDCTGGKRCDMLWVADRARGYGFGSLLVDTCGVTQVANPLIESIAFWKNIGFKSSYNTDGVYIRMSVRS